MNAKQAVAVAELAVHLSHLARLGVIDPHGFEEREAPKPSRASKTRAMRRRQSRGGDCNGLREFNERMRGPWIG